MSVSDFVGFITVVMCVGCMILAAYRAFIVNPQLQTEKKQAKETRCKKCGCTFSVKERDIGYFVKCKSCGEQFRLDDSMILRQRGKKKNGLQGFPHVIHVILVILSMGLWLPVYGVHYVIAKRNAA